LWNKEKAEQERVILSRKIELWENNQDNKKTIMENINESSSPSLVNGPLNTKRTPPYTHA